MSVWPLARAPHPAFVAQCSHASDGDAQLTSHVSIGLRHTSAKGSEGGRGGGGGGDGGEGGSDGDGGGLGGGLVRSSQHVAAHTSCAHHPLQAPSSEPPLASAPQLLSVDHSRHASVGEAHQTAHVSTAVAQRGGINGGGEGGREGGGEGGGGEGGGVGGGEGGGGKGGGEGGNGLGGSVGGGDGVSSLANIRQHVPAQFSRAHAWSHVPLSVPPLASAPQAEFCAQCSHASFGRPAAHHTSHTSAVLGEQRAGGGGDGGGSDGNGGGGNGGNDGRLHPPHVFRHCARMSARVHSPS